MHHSRLCTIVIDCHGDELAPLADFWSQALGKPIASLDQDGDGKYAELQTAADEPIILLQKVTIPAACTWTSRPTTSKPRWPDWNGWAPAAWHSCASVGG